MLRKTRLAAAIALTTTICLPATVFATNGYQLIGVGAYQKSLGGAVTANPGSAMTAVANPAGVARIGRRADFSMEAFMPDRDVDFSALGGERENSAVDLYGVPAIGWVAPTSDGSDLYFGGGMYGTSGLGVDFAQTEMMPGVFWDAYSNIAFWQMAPALAWNVNDRLSVGAAVTIDYQSVAFQQRALTDLDGDGSADDVFQNFDLGRAASSFGYGLSFGAIYDINKMVSVGAYYKSKQNFSDLEYNLAPGDITGVNPATGAPAPLPGGRYKLDLDFPQQFSTGIAVRPTNELTISADVKWIDWSDTMDKLSVTGPVDVPMDPGWDDQIVYALGVAWKASDKVNLRAGFNYGESPIDDDQVGRNLILPAVVEEHYTIGGDYRFNEYWELGAHYMYVPENSQTSTSTNPMELPGAKVSMSQDSFGVNIGYRF